MNNENTYFINKSTCALIPVGADETKIVEYDSEFIIKKSIKNIIDESCRFFGSSYAGRIEGSKNILKMNYKLPIVIEEFNSFIFFPTSSPRFNDCIWISLSNIKSYSKCDKACKIIFVSGYELMLDNSYYSLENQIFRASLLDSLLRNRRES